MTRITSAVVLVAAITTTGVRADPGPAEIGTAIGQYNAVTGKLIISAVNVNNWYFDSASGSLTGDEPNFPGDGIPTNNDHQIGETDLAILPTLIDHDLGLVAQPGLPCDDLTLYFNAGLGTPLRKFTHVRYCIPEPTSVCLLALGLCGVRAVRHRVGNRLH